MSDKLQTTVTYDLTKNIKDIELNTGFILGLDAVLMYYITEVVEDPSTLKATFKKFETIITGEVEEKDLPQLSQVESQIYTVFALQQLFKSKAKQQNLEKEVETQATKADLQAYADAFLSNKPEEAKKKLEEIRKLTVVK